VATKRHYKRLKKKKIGKWQTTANRRRVVGQQQQLACKQDIFSVLTDYIAAKAHLVPASEVNSLTWLHVVSWVLGLTDFTDYEKIEKAILGVCQKVNPARQADADTDDTKNKRETSTGIKHLPQNKICLMSQAIYYDQRLCIFVIPTMTLEEAKNWDGCDYNAIVMVGAWEDSMV